MTNLRRNRKVWAMVLLILALVLGTLMVHAADVTIDLFDNVVQTLSVDDNSVPSTQTNQTIDPATVGGERDFSVTFISGTTTNLGANSGTPASSALSFSSNTSTQGRGIVTFDGSDGSATLDPDGLCNPTCLDLTDSGANTHLRVRLVENDLPTTVHFRLYDGSANNAADYIEFAVDTIGGVNPDEAVDVLMPFSAFAVFGSVTDYTDVVGDVGAIEIFYNRDSITTAVDVAIDFFDATGAAFDFGDLPETGTSYPTTLVNNGARHLMSDQLRLGTQRDSEDDGSPNPTATGDDSTVTDLDDEDGVERVAGYNWDANNDPSPDGAIIIDVSGCEIIDNPFPIDDAECNFYGWFDWNGDGDFGDAGENAIIENQSVGNGLNQGISFDIPAGFPTGSNVTIAARFRICQPNDTCNTITGAADTGEVEDYIWSFGPTAVSLQSIDANSASPMQLATLIGGLLLVVLGGGAFLYRRQNA